MSGQITNTADEIVFTARRRWSDGEKRGLLLELAASGLSVSEFARRRGLARDLLFRWRREERDRSPSSSGVTGFIPLSLPVPRSGADQSIEIVLASGVRLIVSERTGIELLKRVVAALA